MTATPLPRRSYIRDPVYSYLFALAVVACAGVALANWWGWMTIAWPNVWGICIWFAGLVALTAAAIATRTHPVGG
jgi:hypothetical protein